MAALHQHFASGLRSLPDFRGKSHLGVALGNLLINTAYDQDCISSVKMRDGSLMILDCRSRTERWAYWTGKYDSSIILKLAKLFTPGFTVLDVGANVGFYSIAWGRKLAQFGGTLHAFEPVSSNFERVREAISLNHLSDVVQVHCVGLGDRQMELPIIVETTNNSKSGNAVLVHGEVVASSEDTVETIKLTTLDEFVKQTEIKRCDLIKVDIEGAEPIFLKGGMGFLSKHRPIIYGEFNSHWMNKFGYSFPDIVEILKPLNYRFFRQVGRRGDFLEIQDLNHDVENVLIVPVDCDKSQLRILGLI